MNSHLAYSECFTQGAALLTDDFPATITIATERYNTQFMDYEPVTKEEKSQYHALRTRLVQKMHQKRKAWRTEDEKLSDTPYSFDELARRSVPVYTQNQPKHFNRMHSVDSNLMAMTSRNLDMNSWNPKRFSNTNIKTSQSIEIISSATAREAFLNPKKKAIIQAHTVTLNRVSSRSIGFTKLTILNNSRKFRTKIFGDYFSNILSDDAFYLGEVQRTPVIVGPKLQSSPTGLPLWTQELFQKSKIWKLSNPDQKFIIAKDPDGDDRVLYPMFKIKSSYNRDTLDFEEMQRLDSSLSRIDEHMGDHFDLRVKETVPNSFFGRALAHKVLLGTLGNGQTRIVELSRQQLSHYKSNAAAFNLSLKDGDIFKFTNMIRAQLLTMNHGPPPLHPIPETIESFFPYLIQNHRYRDWFETLYWLSLEQIKFSHKKVFNGTAAPPAFLLPNKHAWHNPTAWISDKSLTKHFSKHGTEMGFATKEDYMASAIDFFEDTTAIQISIARGQKDTFLKYNFETQELAVMNLNGEIITYYRLTDEYRSADEFHDYLGKSVISR